MITKYRLPLIYSNKKFIKKRSWLSDDCITSQQIEEKQRIFYYKILLTFRQKSPYWIGVVIDATKAFDTVRHVQYIENQNFTLVFKFERPWKIWFQNYFMKLSDDMKCSKIWLQKLWFSLIWILISYVPLASTVNELKE